MKLERDAKFGEESTRRLKIGISNLINFDPSTWKVSKILILMGSFWAKYILFELKKYRGVIFHETEEEYRILRGIDTSFQNWQKEFDKIWPTHLKVSKIFVWMCSFWAYIVWAKKSTEELSFMKLKRDTKLGEESTRAFKIGIGREAWGRPQKSQRFSF